MTTTITVQPASHDVLVTTLGADGAEQDKTVLQAGSQSRVFYAHSDAKINIEEVASEEATA